MSIYEEIADLMLASSTGQSLGWSRERFIAELQARCPDPEEARALRDRAFAKAEALFGSLREAIWQAAADPRSTKLH